MTKQTIFSITAGVSLLLLGFLLASQKNPSMPLNKEPNNSIVNSLPKESPTMPQPSSAPIEMTAPPQMEVDQAKQYIATLTTSAGVIKIELNAAATPKTVNNFVTLAKNDFYNGTIFHRVMKGFMIQGGDPEGNGTGGPGYKFDDEPFDGEYTRGTVAMANSGPNTNGSQFFIMHQDYALPKNYVIFGKVIEGIETVDAIANADVATSPSGEPSKPVNPVVVQTVMIEDSN